MKLAAFVLIVGCASATLWSAPEQESRNVLFTRLDGPKGWVKQDRASPLVPVSGMVALKQRNLDELDRLFTEASNPGHPNWQNWMTSQQILDVVAPTKQDHDEVLAWLVDGGVKMNKIVSHGDAIEFTTTASVAERLFKTQFFVFQNTETKQTKVNQIGDYSVPTRISQLIDFVSGLSYFPIPHYKSQKSASARKNVGAQPVSIPQTLYNIYQYPTETPGSESNMSQGVIEFEQQYFSPTDLSGWGNQVAIKVSPVAPNHLVGKNVPSSPQLEATLDIEMVSSVNDEAANWFWIEPGNNWLYEFSVHVFGTTTVPYVQSISYGWAEWDQCAISPSSCTKIGVNSQGYVLRVNAEFQKIGLRGVSLIVASGDSGANGRTDEGCTEKHLNPDYPACSPYVLSVGATQLANAAFSLKSPPPLCSKPAWKCMSGGTEQAVSYAQAEFASGGGFSNYAAMPSWQTTVVNAYLKSGVTLPPAGYYNASGRAYPDVAAIGNDVLIYTQGALEVVGGTSASSPTWATVASLMNAAAYEKTGKPLGFLPPLIYAAAAATPSCFHDITVGDNKCTEDGCAASCKGYLCTKSWDPVTGFGSPNVNCLINYVSTLADKRKSH